MSDDIKLPPLPEADYYLAYGKHWPSKDPITTMDGYSGDDMRFFARVAVVADRAERASADDNLFRTLALELVGLIEESSGVYGLHLNGDVSPWDELLPQGRFERLTSLHDAIEALQTPPADRAESAHGIVEKESGNG